MKLWWYSIEFAMSSCTEVLSMGILYCRCHNCEWSSCRASEESNLRSVRILYDQLHLPHRRCMDMGWWLAFHHFRCRLHGLCGLANIIGYYWCIIGVCLCQSVLLEMLFLFEDSSTTSLVSIPVGSNHSTGWQRHCPPLRRSGWSCWYHNSGTQEGPLCEP